MFRETAVQRVAIEKLEMCLQRSYPLEMVNSNVDTYIKHIADELIIDFRRFLAAKKHTSTSEEVSATTRVPDNWVEAVKERWAPRWFLRKYPVVYRSIDTKIVKRTEITNICPHLTLPADNRAHIEFLMLPALDFNRRGATAERYTA